MLISFIVWCLHVNSSLTITFPFSVLPFSALFSFFSFFLRLSIVYNLSLFSFLL
jgi:hypothetical protein